MFILLEEENRDFLSYIIGRSFLEADVVDAERVDFSANFGIVPSIVQNFVEVTIGITTLTWESEKDRQQLSGTAEIRYLVRTDN